MWILKSCLIYFSESFELYVFMTLKIWCKAVELRNYVLMLNREFTVSVHQDLVTIWWWNYDIIFDNINFITLWLAELIPWQSPWQWPLLTSATSSSMTSFCSFSSNFLANSMTASVLGQPLGSSGQDSNVVSRGSLVVCVAMRVWLKELPPWSAVNSSSTNLKSSSTLKGVFFQIWKLSNICHSHIPVSHQ